MHRGGDGRENWQQGLSWGSAPALLAAAHELKAPLVLMRQLALEMRDTPANETATISDQIQLTAERGLRLVDQLTRTARLEDAFFQTEPVNINEIASSVAVELTPLARQLGQKIVVRSSRQLPAVVANRDLLRSALVSLCDNALQHNQPSEPVEVVLVRRQGNVVVSVRDHGPWVSSESFRQMCDRLGAMPQPVSGRPRSSGLGLLVVGTLARRMGSVLKVVRHRQQGLSFQMELPMSQQMMLFEL